MLRDPGKVGSRALGLNRPNRRATGSQVAMVFPDLLYDGCSVLIPKKYICIGFVTGGIPLKNFLNQIKMKDSHNL